MGQVTTVGLDIAKSVFQVHGIDESAGVVLRRRVVRARLLAFFAKLPACLIGIEACATSHYWARELRKLGHDPVDAAELRQAVCEAPKERQHRTHGRTDQSRKTFKSPCQRRAVHTWRRRELRHAI
jgi:hypothetical protein